jgi:hypothetical protein
MTELAEGPAPRQQSLDVHLARLVLLFDAFTKRGSKIDGLTKLAKLDFLLRYPVMLGRVLADEGRQWITGAEPTDDEERAVEARMTRYKYGPWDDRYYALVGSLVGLGLCEETAGRGRISLRATALGSAVTAQLSELPEWHATSIRCEQLAQDLDRSGNQLKELIYRRLPEAVDRPHRTLI